MNSSRKARGSLALIAVLALAGCGNNSPGAATSPDGANSKSPLAEYMGDGFSTNSGGGMSIRIGGSGNQQPTEEELNQQRQMEDSIVRCMQTAGFRYVAVPPESQPKAKFNDAFNLPPDKFAEQYGYGISTIDMSAPAADTSNPNTPIRNALSATAKKAYDKALNGAAGSDGRVIVGDKPGNSTAPTDTGCRGKAVEAVLGKTGNKADEMKKYDSLFKDLEALQRRIQADARVVAATQSWSDCLANAGKPGYRKTEDTRKKVEQKLAALTGQQNGPGAAPEKAGPPPSFDKVDAVKLADLRKFEIDLAKADQKCKAKVYDAEYKKAQYELEREFVTEHKAELEQFRDGMAQR
ncbi:MAG TPA: hypothetical protein VGD71_23315 [Kribbella sp.]|jgi:hypothetical protein